MLVNGIDHDTLAEILRDEATPVTGAGDSDAPWGAIMLYVLTEPLTVDGFGTVPMGVYTRSVEDIAVYVHAYASQADAMRAVVAVAHDDALNEANNRDAYAAGEAFKESAFSGVQDTADAHDAWLDSLASDLHNG